MSSFFAEWWWEVLITHACSHKSFRGSFRGEDVGENWRFCGKNTEHIKIGAFYQISKQITVQWNQIFQINLKVFPMKTDSWVTNQLLGWNRAEFKNCLLPKECEFVDYSSGKLWRWNNENLMILCPHKKWTRSGRFDWVVLRCKMLASHLNFGRTRIEFCCNVFHKMAQVFTRWLRGIKLFSGKWLFQPPRCFPPFAGNWRCIQRCTSSLPFPCWLPQALELHLKIWNTLKWIKT